jgi:hypothetical protein
MRPYRYVGPADLMTTVRGGAPIESKAALAEWLAPRPDRDEPFTFVISESGHLLLAPRRSEHVACAGGAPVLNAGEIIFDDGQVVAITNQSTGYCPDVSSWTAVAQALDQAGIPHPGRFTGEIVFRRCTSCGETSIVRENYFVCVFCDADLPAEWNIG